MLKFYYQIESRYLYGFSFCFFRNIKRIDHYISYHRHYCSTLHYCIPLQDQHTIKRNGKAQRGTTQRDQKCLNQALSEYKEHPQIMGVFSFFYCSRTPCTAGETLRVLYVAARPLPSIIYLTYFKLFLRARTRA